MEVVFNPKKALLYNYDTSLKTTHLQNQFTERKPYLSWKHKKLLEWALKRKDWTVEDWGKVI